MDDWGLLTSHRITTGMVYSHHQERHLPFFEMAPTPTMKTVASTPNKDEIPSVTPNKAKKTPTKKTVASTPNKDEIVSVTSNKKLLKQKGLFGFMKKRAPPVISIKDLHYGDLKYSRIRGWNESGTVLSLPIEQQQDLSELSKLQTAAMKEREWSDGDKIQQDMGQLKGSIAGMSHNIEEAKGALKESLVARSYYIKEGKPLVAGKWDTIALAAQAVLAQYFQHNAEREEQSNRKTVELDAVEVDRPCEEEADKPAGEDDLEQQEADPLNPFDAPEKSYATRHRKERTSVATGVRAPKVRRLDKFMSRREFDGIINKPWERKSSSGVMHSGPNKNGHGMSYVAAVGQITCEACFVYVTRKRIAQHIIGTAHENRLKSFE